MVNMTHLVVPAGFHTSQLVLCAINRVPDKHGFSSNYFVTGVMNIVISISGNKKSYVN